VHVSQCFCRQGFYDKHRKNSIAFDMAEFRSWASNDDFSPKCYRCPDNTACNTSLAEGWGTTVKTIKTNTGYWRATNSTTTIYPCPDDFACKGGSFIEDDNVSLTVRGSNLALIPNLGERKKHSALGDHTNLHDSELYGLATELVLPNSSMTGLDFEVRYYEDRDRQCTGGYIGLLCRSCDLERGFVKQWRKCEQCEKGATERAKILLIVSLVCVLVILAICFVKYPANTMAFLNERNMPFKIFVGFIQVASTIPDNFRLLYPPLVIDFFAFMRYLNVFDVFTFTANFSCVLSYNYYFMLLLRNIGPLAVLGLLVLIMLFGMLHLSRSAKALLLNSALLFSLTVYTSMYTSLFQYFDCRAYEDGQLYLVVEPSIKCTDSSYLGTLWIVSVLCVIVTVGFPLAYYLLLRSQQESINPVVLGRFNKFGEEMATANIQVFGRNSTSKSLWNKNTNQRQRFSVMGLFNKSLRAKEEGQQPAADSQSQLISDFWGGQLTSVLRMDADDDQLKSGKFAECSALIKRAYNIQLSLYGPASANQWLQECSRGCDKDIESSKFLWVSGLQV
jgi:hypothetical protein